MGPPKPVHYPPVRILRVLAMPQPFFLELSGLAIHRSYLLKLGVKIYSYNDHVRLFLPSLLVGFSTTKVYSGIGADIVMESISLIDPATGGLECNGWLQQLIVAEEL